MELCNFDKVYRFGWCTGWDMDKARAVHVDFGKAVRICYTTTQMRRMYLVAQSGGLSFVPYEMQDGKWRQLYPHQWNVREVPDNILESLETLKRSLDFQMILQFRDSVTGYYEQAPAAGDIHASLPKNPTVADLEATRYAVYEATVQRDPEWDGAVQVLCAGGWLLYPYRVEEGGTRRLITKYRTFEPASRGEEIFSGWGRFCDKLLSMFDNLHWSTLRNRVEHLGGNW